jgi:DNA processing protein
VVNCEAFLGGGVVSGGAVGIDRAAHQAALDSQKPQIAVLAGGLDQLYPRANVGLFQQIKISGILLSEAPATIVSEAHRFLHRNRLIAALSNAVVVVEAAWRSGAMNTASHAAALGRGLGVVPGRWEDQRSAGCFRVVRERGALVLSEPGDIELLLRKPRKASPYDEVVSPLK